ncbi:methionine ABC transporter permease [Stackebrandtia soli]|uniref:methionine ABC transporter permease n=1 Tax=Stackebrandtia soli TaxID=1892856 RepID=UPI0039E91BE3
MTENLIRASLETLHMIGLSTLWTIVGGSGLGVILFVTRSNGLAPNGVVNRVLGVIVNIGRSAPFIILMVAISSLTRLIAGTTIGSAAAVVPLSVAAIPFFARLVESALIEVDPGLIEAAEAMGARRRGIVWRVLVPEALPALVRGLTVTIVALTGYSAMAGAIGGGGLGDLAVRFGYHRYQTEYLIVSVVLLIVLVQIVQFVGDLAARRLDHR